MLHTTLKVFSRWQPQLLGNGPIEKRRTMRNFTLLAVLLVVALSASGCRKDPLTLADRLVGTWNTAVLDVNCPGPAFDERYLFTGCQFDWCHQLVLEPDGRAILDFVFSPTNQGVRTGQWWVDQEWITLCFAGLCLEGPVDFQGTRLILSLENGNCLETWDMDRF